MKQRTVIQPGDRYERLTVQERMDDWVFPSGQRQRVWRCVCDCGTVKDFRGSDLRTGHAKSCGCYRSEVAARNHIDLTGQTFARLRVTARAGSNSRRKATWHCVCECGAEAIVEGANLRGGRTTSCGCMKSDLTIDRNSIQGGNAQSHPLYVTWRRMIARCTTPSLWNYQYYGALGVRVSDRWTGPGGFLRFAEDMGDKPPTPSTWESDRPYWTLDRIDPRGDYEPGNCRWADPHTQARNKRTDCGWTDLGPA